MLSTRVTSLGRALILPALFASAFAGELDFEFENLVANNVQIPWNHSDNNYQLDCHGIARISPASQVFFPSAVSALFQNHGQSLMSTLRFSPICGRHRSLGQLKLAGICLLRVAWYSRGHQLDC
jgi:hypothetical protein